MSCWLVVKKSLQRFYHCERGKRVGRDRGWEVVSGLPLCLITSICIIIKLVRNASIYTKKKQISEMSKFRCGQYSQTWDTRIWKMGISPWEHRLIFKGDNWNLSWVILKHALENLYTTKWSSLFVEAHVCKITVNSQ